jgi:hypothetical protein
MKRIWKYTLLALPLTVAVALGAAWYVASGEVVNHAKSLVEQANAATHPEGLTLTIAYESVTRSHFPSVGVRFVNPSISFSDAGDGVGRPPFSFEWKREGHVDFVSDVRTRTYRLVSHGSGRTVVRADNQSFEIASEPSDMELALTARDRAAYKTLQELDLRDRAAVEKAVRELAGISLRASDILLSESGTQTTLYSQRASSLVLTNRSTESTYDFDATIQVKDSEITKTYSDMLARFTSALQMPLAINDEIMPFSSTRAGKQNMELAVRAKLPRNAEDSTIDDGYIHVNQFTVTNAYYQLSAPFDLVIAQADERRTAAIKGNWQFELTKAGGAEMSRPGLNKSILLVLAKRAGVETIEADPELLQQKLLASLPSVSTLGPIEFRVDLEASTPMPKASASAIDTTGKDDRREMLTINALSFTHPRWGMDVKGMAARVGKNEMTVDFTIICQKCETMTRDIYDVASATQEVMSLLNPKREAWYMNEAMLANVNKTLAEIGRKDEATGDIVFGIGSPSPNDIRINGKPMSQVMLKFMAMFMDPEKAAQLQSVMGMTQPEPEEGQPDPADGQISETPAQP